MPRPRALSIGLLLFVPSVAAAQAGVPAGWLEALVHLGTSPLVAPLLLALGFVGLLIEIKTPHFGVAGLTGLTALGLFFGSHLALGLAGWATLVLLAAGLVLLAVEAFVLPGFGVAGVLGIAAVVASIFVTLAGPAPTAADVWTAGAVIASSVALVVFALWQILRHLPNDSRGRNLLLQASTSREQGYVASLRRDELVGREGVAVTDLRPAGVARVGEERLDVVAERGFVPAGTPIRVLRAEGYRHVVGRLG